MLRSVDTGIDVVAHAWLACSGDAHGVVLGVSCLQGISLETPPGTKLLLKDPAIPVRSGFIVLPEDLTVLGGRVPELYDRWKVQKELGGRNRQVVSGDGPPLFAHYTAQSLEGNARRMPGPESGLDPAHADAASGRQGRPDKVRAGDARGGREHQQRGRRDGQKSRHESDTRRRDPPRGQTQAGVPGDRLPRESRDSVTSRDQPDRRNHSRPDGAAPEASVLPTFHSGGGITYDDSRPDRSHLQERHHRLHPSSSGGRGGDVKDDRWSAGRGRGGRAQSGRGRGGDGRRTRERDPRQHDLRDTREPRSTPDSRRHGGAPHLHDATGPRDDRTGREPQHRSRPHRDGGDVEDFQRAPQLTTMADLLPVALSSGPVREGQPHPTSHADRLQMVAELAPMGFTESQVDAAITRFALADLPLAIDWLLNGGYEAMSPDAQTKEPGAESEADPPPPSLSRSDHYERAARTLDRVVSGLKRRPADGGDNRGAARRPEPSGTIRYDDDAAPASARHGACDRRSWSTVPADAK